MISKLIVIETITANKVVLDIGEWQSLTVQVVGITGTGSLLGTNDDGSITGSVQGNATTATNFTAVQAINLTTGAAATAATLTNLFRIDPVAFKFLQIGDGSTFGATKVLVQCTKPY